MAAKWYWVKWRNEKLWAEEKPGYSNSLYIPNWDGGIDKTEFEILAGPLTETQIDQAYFGYWV